LSHPHYLRSSKPPGVIRAIRVLLWLQAGIGAVQCWFDPLIVYVIVSGSHTGDPPSATDAVGVVVFGLVLFAAAPQLAFIALRLSTGGPSLRVWALSVLAAPLVLSVVYGITAVFDADLLAVGSIEVVASLSVLAAPVPIAVIWFLLTPTARAWFRR